MMEFSDLVAKYSDRGQNTNIAVGLRPSGTIHLGNMATTALAGVLAKRIGPHISDINVTICDLDLPDVSDWSVHDHAHVKYFASLPDRLGCHNSMLEHTTEGLEDYLGGLADTLGVDYEIRRLSDIQANPSFRKGLRKVLDTPGTMQLVHPACQPGKAMVFPICPKCGTSDPRPSDYKNGILSTACTNDACDIGVYEVDVEDTSRNLAVHFFIDPLRDRVISPKNDVHVFGGDYRDPHCSGDKKREFRIEDRPIQKWEKIAEITRIASDGESPDFLIGPKFYARDGDKMSKGKENGLTLDKLKEHFGRDTAAKVVGLVEATVDRDLRNVDYHIVAEMLFK